MISWEPETFFGAGLEIWRPGTHFCDKRARFVAVCRPALDNVLRLVIVDSMLTCCGNSPVQGQAGWERVRDSLD